MVYFHRWLIVIEGQRRYKHVHKHIHNTHTWKNLCACSHIKLNCKKRVAIQRPINKVLHIFRRRLLNFPNSQDSSIRKCFRINLFLHIPCILSHSCDVIYSIFIDTFASAAASALCTITAKSQQLSTNGNSLSPGWLSVFLLLNMLPLPWIHFIPSMNVNTRTSIIYWWNRAIALVNEYQIYLELAEDTMENELIFWNWLGEGDWMILRKFPAWHHWLIRRMSTRWWHRAIEYFYFFIQKMWILVSYFVYYASCRMYHVRFAYISS